MGLSNALQIFIVLFLCDGLLRPVGFVVVIYGKEPTAYNKMAFIRHYWPRQKRFLNLDQELYTPRRSPALMMQ